MGVLQHGLLAQHDHSIYAAFQKNKREGLVPDWFFKGWCDESSSFMRHVSVSPLRPSAPLQTDIGAFRPAWKVRINVNRILSDPDNLERVPGPFRKMRSLSLLLETAAIRARRLAGACPSLAVPQFFNGKVQYLLSVCMDDPEQTDLVMALQPMGGYYQCVTCLTLEMAYCNAMLPEVVAAVEVRHKRLVQTKTAFKGTSATFEADHEAGTLLVRGDTFELLMTRGEVEQFIWELVEA